MPFGRDAMKFCVCPLFEADARVSQIITAFRERFDADIVVGQGADLRAVLPESDLAIAIGTSSSRDIEFLEAVGQECIDYVSIILIDEMEDDPDAASVDAYQLPIRLSAIDEDMQALLNELDRRLTRISTARHEYNNIAAVVGLTSNPAMLERAREALRTLRETYPEYCADPDKLDEKLGLKHPN
ncbi:MAG: hypothetical protein IT320_12745 [Anaerolineae bacterium]|nr:hypothetical protein [Anaerolineae bacterium]